MEKKVSNQDQIKANFVTQQEEKDRLLKISQQKAIEDKKEREKKAMAQQAQSETGGKSKDEKKDSEKALPGESYTGEIVDINNRHVTQMVNGRPILHNRAALSGLNKFKKNEQVEIKYPSGNAGIVKQPEQEKNKTREHDLGSRER